MTVASLRLDYSLWGAVGRGFHATNVAIHAVCSTALLALVVALLGASDPAGGDDGGSCADAVTRAAMLGASPPLVSGTMLRASIWPPLRLLLPATLSCVLFAVHPVHVEAVASIVGRADALAGIFYVAALLA